MIYGYYFTTTGTEYVQMHGFKKLKNKREEEEREVDNIGVNSYFKNSIK